MISLSTEPHIVQPTVAFTTVGCRLNQAETDAVQDTFASAGYRIVEADDRPNVHYVNTCTVTGRADRSSRQWIHRVRRDSPEAVIIVAGCFANRAVQELADAGEVDIILGQREKMYPLRHLDDPFQRPEKPVLAIEPGNSVIHASVGLRVTGRSRAFLKIQDGCDHSCTYCAVAPARGPSVSAPIAEIKESLRRIVDAGFEEVVFTGVDVSDWRSDEKSRFINEPDFVTLVGLAVDAGLPRVRLSSLEPWSLSPERIERLASHDAWCEHLHLSLQSGDSGILKAMNRSMDLGELREAMQELIRLRPKATIGADIIAGFPGETEKAFEATKSLIEEGWIHYLHVFPYSARPGTAAAKFKKQVDSESLQRRAGELRQISRIIRKNKVMMAVGEKCELLVERDKRSGYTKNYLRASLVGDSSRGPGKRVDAMVTAYNMKTLTLEAEETDEDRV